MRIPHLTRSKASKFYPLVVAAIDQGRDRWPLHIPLMVEGGYKGNIRVEIGASRETEFEADWEAEDWTRFPARIRAACTALRDRGCLGTFRISHDDGALSIHHSGDR